MRPTKATRQLDVVHRFRKDLYFPRAAAGGDAVAPAGQAAAGDGLVIAPILQRLGFQVNLLGPYTAEDEGARAFLLAEGARSYLRPVAGPGPVHAVVEGDGEPRSLQVVRAAAFDLSPEQGDHLSTGRSEAFVLVDDLGPGCTETVLSAAAALDRACFWKPPRRADLRLAGAGRVYLQVAHGSFARAGEAPAALAARLLAETGAAGCVVTGPVPGEAHGVGRGNACVLRAPAAPAPRGALGRRLGRDAAFFAGLIAAALNTPAAGRLERGLHLGRLTAAYHLSGAPALSWHQLGLLEKQLGPGFGPVQAAA
jgi:hypothetical protein